MDAKYKITIPKPCHEDWNKMSPDETGRFCSSCVKSVVDFTHMKTSEIQNYFIANQGKSVCGRFKNDQLESIIIKIPSQVLYSQVNFHKMFLLVLLISMGATLFSCTDKNGNQQKIEKVEIVNDPIEHGQMTLGEITPEMYDSLNPPPMPKIDKVRFVKEPSLKGKVKCKDIKSEDNSKIVITSGMVRPQIIGDTIRIEKK